MARGLEERIHRDARFASEVSHELRSPLTTLKASVGVLESRKNELSTGLLFLSYGPMSSQLMGGDTHGTGMPDSKSFDVLLEPLSKK